MRWRAKSWALKKHQIFFLKDHDGRATHSSSPAAPAIISHPIVRSIVVTDSTPASSATPSPPPTTTVRLFRAFSLANFVKSLPAIALCQRASVTFLGAAHLFFLLFYETLWNACRGSLCFNQ